MQMMATENGRTDGRGRHLWLSRPRSDASFYELSDVFKSVTGMA